MSDPTATEPAPVAPAADLRQQRQRMLSWIAGIGLLLIGIFLMLANQPAGDGKLQKIITIPPGASAKKVAAQLAEAGLLRSPTLFVLRAKLTGKSAAIKAGPYQFTDDMHPSAILTKLVNGEIDVWRFAVPEGYSIFQLAELLATRKIVAKDAFLTACRNPDLLKEFKIPGETVEGYLYPSTYDITPGSSATTIVRLMLRQFDREYQQRFSAISSSRKFSRHDLLTLASMVEKEAIAPQERPQIAAVFLNRLSKRMRLQSDPTAVYGQRAFGGAVSAQDVRQATPYNTYKIAGLPPGPIGNPSAEAIAAVLAPAAVPHLYFVAKQDGTHYFSTTLVEHNQAVTRYLKNGAH